MTDIILELVAEYGLWLIGITTFLSCLAIPVPASLMMIAGGAFAASSDLSLIGIAAAAFLGAVAGDQTGFAIGRRGKTLFQRLKNGTGRRGNLFRRAKHFADNWGRTGVFLSRWLFSPLGPCVNFIGGATGLNWMTFTLAAVLGEIIWVSLYTGLGFVFASHIDMVADFASNISALLAAALIAALLGRFLFRTVA